MNNPTPHGKSVRVGPPIGAGASQNSASSAGSSRHFAKVSTQASQLRGPAGATQGGFATGQPSPRTHNMAGKTASEGKVKGSR